MKNLLCALVLMFVLHLNATEPIRLHEAETTLQQSEESSLEASLLKFAAKGGTIIRLDGDAPPFTFLPGDMVFPACSGANNRSQTVWNLLRPYADKISLIIPHATQYGFDPYNGKPNWLRYRPPQDNDEFYLWAGIEKSPKLGWDLFEEWMVKEEPTAEELTLLTDYYNRFYFQPEVPAETRRVYITFAKNAHIHLYRLQEVNDSLENVIVLFFPLDDMIKHPLPEWDTSPGSVITYTKLGEILGSYFDFHKLDSKK